MEETELSDDAGSEAPVRRRFIITGRVQGVGFRFWTARRAQSLQLSGTVRNRADGRVEVEVEGPAGTVTRFREVLARGPEMAIVRTVEEAPPGEAALPADFRIVF
jgi:acylphosphatase